MRALIIHMIFNKVHFLYLSKFGHLSTKEGNSVIGKPLKTPCPLSQYELNDDTGSRSKSFKRSSTRPLPVLPL